MSAYFDKEKKTYYVKFRYKDWTGKTKQTTKRGFLRKKDATDYEKDFIQQQKGATGLSFKTIVEKYLEHLKTHVRQNSYESSEYICKNYISPYFDNLPISDISIRTIMDWQNKFLLPKNFSPTSAKMINGRVSAIFNFAKKYYGIPVNPVPLAGPVGSLSKRTDNMTIWTPDQFTVFIRTIRPKDDRYKIIFSTLFWTGARPCEIIGLTKSDIDFEQNVIHITKSLHYKNKNENYYTPPKNKSSARDILIPNFLSAELAEYLAKLYNLKDDDMIFSVNLQAVRYELQKYIAIAGLPQIRLYSLRHSHASYLVNSNIDLISIADRMGHKDTTTTLSIYSHLYKNRKKEITDFLENKHKKMTTQ